MESKRIRRLRHKANTPNGKRVPLYQNPGLKKILFKFLIIGDYGVGTFSSTYKVTVGADFSTKTITREDGTRVSVQLWDISGQERYCYMTRAYYKYAAAAALVFDLTRLATFYTMSKWLDDLREKVTLNDGSPIPVILLATKCDVKGTHVATELINKFCKDNDISAWFITSAKDNIRIDEAVNFLIEQCIDVPPKELTSDSFTISQPSEKTKSQIKKNSLL